MRLALAAALSALVLAAPAGAAAKPRCRLPSNATVIASNSLAIVYSVGSEPPVHRACLRKSGRRRLLQPTYDPYPDPDPSVHRMTLTGRYVGWVELFHDRHDQTTGNSWVYDLKRGRMRWTGGGPYRPGGDPPEVTDLALGDSGRLVFATRERRVEYREPDGTPGEWRTVWVRDASGTRKLEEGRDAIDLTSLDLTGLTATWVSGGQTRSAQLY